MRKIFTIFTLSALLGCSNLFAGVHKVVKNEDKVSLSEGMSNVKHKTPRVDISNLSSRMMNTRASDAPEVITNAPGTPQTMMKSCEGYYLLWGSWLTPYIAGAIDATVNVDGNDVYFYNIFNNADFNTYVAGTRSGNSITVEMGQSVYYEEVEGDLPLNITLNVFQLGEMVDEYGELVPTYLWVPEITSVTYTIGDNGEWVLQLPGEPFDGVNPREYVIGLLDKEYGDWLGYCDYNQTYQTFDETPVEVPDGAVLESYTCVSGSTGYTVEVAIYDGKVYLSGLSQYFSDFTVMGELKDGKAYIPQGQYLGKYDEYYIFTRCGYYNENYNPYDPYSPEYLLTDLEDDFVLNVDLENNVITSVDPDLYLLFNSGVDRLNYLDAFSNLKIEKQTSFAGTPSNPSSLYWTPFLFEYYGLYYFDFDLSMISTEGNLLDIDSLYYSIYVDGELMTFVPDEEEYIYSGLEGPTTLIPYTLDNYWDIYKSSDTYFQVGLYDKNYTTLGVQAVYIYDGVTTRSDLMTLNIETGEVSGSTTGISSIEGNKIVDTKYYSLDGVNLTKPVRGINLERVTYEDGTVKTRKVLVK